MWQAAPPTSHNHGPIEAPAHNRGFLFALSYAKCQFAYFFCVKPIALPYVLCVYGFVERALSQTPRQPGKEMEMDIQSLIDAIGNAAADTRANYHLTLGGAIEALSLIDGKKPMTIDAFEGYAPSRPHSYRGYYSDLAFEADGEPATVGSFLALCRDARGQTFEGYKGGDFTMTDQTPLWVADYGSCGRAIIGLSDDEKSVTLITKVIA